MATRAAVSSVTAPVVIADGGNSSAQAPRSFLVKVPSTSTATLYVGGDDLTQANTATKGYPVAAGDPAIAVDLSAGEQLFAAAATGTTATVIVLTIRS